MPWPVLRVGEFILGMCLAWAMRRGWLPRIPLIVPIVLLGVWFVALATLPDSPSTAALFGGVSPYTNEVATVIFALLIVSAASLELRGKTRLMRGRPLVALGEWSFAFYLIHATLIYAALNLVGKQSGWIGLLWIVGLLGAAIVASWILHVYVEAPVERRLRRWQDGRRQGKRADRVDGGPAATTDSARLS